VSTIKEAWPIHYERIMAMIKDKSYSEFTKIQIPFEASTHPPLPSWEEIEQGFTEYYKPRPRSGKAFRVGAFFVKFGSDPGIFQVSHSLLRTLQQLTRSQEAEILLFLQANSQVRVPKVYAAFTRQLFEWTKHFIIIDYIEGETLSGTKWLSLGENSRSIILSRLCEQFQLLRSIPSEGYYGCVHRQGWIPYYSFLRKMQPGPAGPYDTYEEFVAALMSSARLTTAMMTQFEDFWPEQSDALSRMESGLRACNGRRPVFTHMDPSVHNTVIRQIVKPGGEEDWEVTLIDWAEAGWLPAWMQTWCLKEKLNMITTMETPNAAEALEYVEYVATHLGEDYTDQRELFEDLRRDISYGLL